MQSSSPLGLPQTSKQDAPLLTSNGSTPSKELISSTIDVLDDLQHCQNEELTTPGDKQDTTDLVQPCHLESDDGHHKDESGREEYRRQQQLTRQQPPDTKLFEFRIVSGKRALINT